METMALLNHFLSKKEIESWISHEFNKKAEEILKKQAEEDEKIFLYGDSNTPKPKGVIKYKE